METNADLLNKIKTNPDKHGCTPAEVANCFNYFMCQRDTAAWKELGAHVADWTYAPDRENSLLELAVQYKNAAAVSYILEENPGLITNDKLWGCLFMRPEPAAPKNELAATAAALLAAGLTIDTPGERK